MRGCWRNWPRRTRPASGDTERRRAIEPADGRMRRGAGKEGVDEVPARRVVDEMVGKQPGRLVAVLAAGAPAGEPVDGLGEDGGLAAEGAAAAPVDRIDMGVDAGDAGKGRRRARPEGRQGRIPPPADV